MSDFVYTTSLSKIRKMKKRIKVINGSSSASKTYSILPILADKAIRNPNTSISVTGESIPFLRRGPLRDFEKIMRAIGRWDLGEFNKSNLTWTLPNGSFIEFFSVDDESRLRGPRRNILYVNEANNISFDAYFQMAIRTLGDIYIDYNPSHEFWADTELIGQPDVETLVLTYRDNEACPQSFIDEVAKAREKAKTSEYWANWVRCFADGERGALSGVIYNNWKQIDKLPEDARLLGMGLDWGYSHDPTAIVAVYEWNGTRILKEVLYMKGLTNSDIAKYIPNDVVVYCDSASPKDIEELRRYGKNSIATMKGPDSINFGIQLIQQREYLVTADSTNLIKELRSYTWDKDKNGRDLNKPIDKFNHMCDAWRYHEMMSLGRVYSTPACF